MQIFLHLFRTANHANSMKTYKFHARHLIRLKYLKPYKLNIKFHRKYHMLVTSVLLTTLYLYHIW